MRSLVSFRQVYRNVLTLNPFSNFFLTAHCSLCGDSCDENLHLCKPCRSELPFIINPCQVCSSPLKHSNTKMICGSCLHTKPFYNESIIPLEYTFPNNYFIKQLKYNGNLEFSSLLSSILSNEISQRKGNLPECVIPVPLHRNRLFMRGYNQSDVIAKSVARHLQLPFDSNICKRVKNTQQQTGLTHKEREINLRNSFSVNKNIPYKHIAILDDVVTTGNTVNELAKSLRSAGVNNIEVWACARATL